MLQHIFSFQYKTASRKPLGVPGGANRMVADAFEGFRDRHVNSIWAKTLYASSQTDTVTSNGFQESDTRRQR